MKEVGKMKIQSMLRTGLETGSLAMRILSTIHQPIGHNIIVTARLP